MKKIIKKLCFLVVLILSVIMIQKVMIPKWNDGWNARKIVQGFYAEPKNSIDVLCLGSSQFMSGISPMEFYGKYGYSAYSLATDQQEIMTSYYWLKEACKTQKIKVLLFETQMLFQKSVDIGYYRKGLDYMKMSTNKLQAINSVCSMDKRQSKASYIFPLMNYHSRWNDLSVEDFSSIYEDKTNFTKGFSVQTRIQKCVPYAGIAETGTDTESISEEKYQYLDKMMQLCKAKNISVVFVKTPRIGDWTVQKHNAITTVASKYNSPFIDFNLDTIYKQTSFDVKNDFRDENHLNVTGAEKLSGYLADYLHENYHLNDYRNKKERTDLSEQYKKYQYAKEDAKLAMCQNIAEYLSKLNTQRYTIAIVSCNEYTKNLDENLKTILTNIGIEKSHLEQYRASFCSVIDRGKVVYDECSTSTQLNCQYSTKNASFDMTSAGYLLGNQASVKVNGKEWAVNTIGLNIVVYDNDLNEVVDSVAFDTYDTMNAKRTIESIL